MPMSFHLVGLSHHELIPLQDYLENLGVTLNHTVTYLPELEQVFDLQAPAFLLIEHGIYNGVSSLEWIHAMNRRFDLYIIYILPAEEIHNCLTILKNVNLYGLLSFPLTPNQIESVIEVALARYQRVSRLYEEERKYRTIFDHSDLGISLINEEGITLEWNRAMEQITGLNRNDALGNYAWDIHEMLIPELRDNPARMELSRRRIQNVLQTGLLQHQEAVELEFTTIGGEVKFVEFSMYLIPTDRGFMASQLIKDISERKKRETEIGEIIKHLKVSAVMTDRFMRTTAFKDAFSAINLFVQEQGDADFVFISRYDARQNSFEVVCLNGLDEYKAQMETILGQPMDHLVFHYHPVSSRYHSGVSAPNPLFSVPQGLDGLFKEFFPASSICAISDLIGLHQLYALDFSSHDFSFGTIFVGFKQGNILRHKNLLESVLNQAAILLQRLSAEEKLANALKEKEFLIHEIHHRVKNNFNTVMNLLALQGADSENLEFRHLVDEAQNRIRSISQIYENLYRQESFQKLDFKVYLTQWLPQLVNSLTAYPIEFIMEIDSIEISVKLAMPCGLIINELVTNCLKYAFPRTMQFNNPALKVSFQHIADGWAELIVADNGIGFSPDFASTPPISFGIRLIRGLTEQLKGKVEWSRQNGTLVTVRFPIR